MERGIGQGQTRGELEWMESGLSKGEIRGGRKKRYFCSIRLSARGNENIKEKERARCSSAWVKELDAKRQKGEGLPVVIGRSAERKKRRSGKKKGKKIGDELWLSRFVGGKGGHKKSVAGKCTPREKRAWHVSEKKDEGKANDSVGGLESVIRPSGMNNHGNTKRNGDKESDLSGKKRI